MNLYQAVFAKACLCNHSCHCNARFYKNNELGTMNIIAIADIPEGEEICVDYCASIIELNAKREKLFQRFNFDCQCSRCVRKQFDENDHILAKFYNLKKEFERINICFEHNRTENKCNYEKMYNICQEIITLSENLLAPSINFELLQIYYRSFMICGIYLMKYKESKKTFLRLKKNISKRIVNEKRLSNEHTSKKNYRIVMSQHCLTFYMD